MRFIRAYTLKIIRDLQVPTGRLSPSQRKAALERRAYLLRRIRLAVSSVLLLSIVQPTLAYGHGLIMTPNNTEVQFPLPEEYLIQIPDIVTPVKDPYGPTYTYTFKLAPDYEYWDRVAYCETRNSANPNGNWQNGGRFAGGLGIMTDGKFGTRQKGTWERWGGEEFASRPDKASKFEQIIVANRIGLYGWSTWVSRDPVWAKDKGVPATYFYDKHPVGFTGWGCIKGTVKAPDKQTKKGVKDYVMKHSVQLPVNESYYCPEIESLLYKYGLPVKLFSHIAWRESKCDPEYIGQDTPGAGLFGIPLADYLPGMSELGYDLFDITIPENAVRLAAWIVYATPERINAWGYNFVYRKHL
jgi:hypothetical protein